MRSIIAFGTMLCVSSVTLAQTLAPDVASLMWRDSVFSVGQDGDEVVFAGRMRINSPPEGTLWDLYEASGAKWNAKFSRNPELVVTYSMSYSLARDRERQSLLFWPESLRAEVRGWPTDGAVRDINSALRKRRILGEYVVGPYVVVRTTRHSMYRFRLIEGDYKITRDVMDPILTYYLGGLTPDVRLNGMSKFIAEGQVRHLERFELTIQPPTKEGAKAQTACNWLPWDDPPSAESGAVFLYAKITSGLDAGYGRTVSEMLASSRDAMPTCVGTLCGLLERAYSATSLEQKQACYHSKERDGLRRWCERDAGMYKRSVSESLAFHFAPPHNTVSPEARLMASLHFGHGTIHYFMNASKPDGKVGSLTPLFLLTEDGESVLAGNAYPYEKETDPGYWINWILTDRRFMEGVRGFVQNRHPRLYSQLSK